MTVELDIDDEILQDFLTEAGELVELLSEQLVELEQSPADGDLLNAIFRNFHTIKGGAGFLGIEPLVGVCHKAEDVFNCLRQGERLVNQALMDVILQAWDVIHVIFEGLRAGQAPQPVSPQLLQDLQAFTVKQVDVPEAIPEPVVVSPVEVLASDDELISEDEFEALLDNLQGAEAKSPLSPVALDNTASDEITDAEFDDLLDQLQAKKTPQPPVVVAQHDEMTEDEFEHLLDQLQGQVKATVKPAIIEPVAEPVKSAPKPAATDNSVRVDTQVLDNIMNMVGELVLIRNRLHTLKSTLEVSEPMTQTLANLDVVTADLQLAVMKTRMQPVKKIFGRFPRVVRDLARSLGKEIRLELVGEETELDKNLVEALADPLVHLIRNAVDHGVETPAEREAAGKPREGLIILKAEQAGDHIELSIKDNGKGMNPDQLRARVVEKGLLDAEMAASLDNKDCFNLIFMPGFSTKTEISDVSGRGVGMDVVKTCINQMNGVVEIDSKAGEGSTILIKVPLTLAIMPTLMVKLGKQVFALPLTSVVEILDMELSKANVVNRQLVLTVRGKILPLFYISDWLINDPAYAPPEDVMGHVVVVNASGRQVGFVVDQLMGQEEVVIKALGAKLQGLVGLSGATITGDGKVALILDVPGLMQKYVH